jgi:PAS domain S-box-containing protein
MPLQRIIKNLEVIRTTSAIMRRRYGLMLAIIGCLMFFGQTLVQQKLTQIGITYEALSDIQQMYELGNLLQPKGLMIAGTQNEVERGQHIQGFASTVELYLQLYAKLRNNPDYHEVFQISDTVKQRIFRLDRENAQIRQNLPILADSISIDGMYSRISTILSIQNASELELSVFVRGYKLELQQMRRFLQFLSFTLNGLLVVGVLCEIFLIFLPFRKNGDRLLEQAEELQDQLSSAFQDISRSTSRYELLVNQAHDCVYQLDTRGRFIFANNATATLLGYDSAMLLETYYLDYVRPDFRRNVMVVYQRQDKQGYSEAIICPVIDAHGNTRWIEQTITKLFDNEMFVGFLGIARDITERREMQSSLEELSSLHALVLENSGSAVITTDMQGTITLFNRAASYLLGFEANEIIGTNNISRLLSAQELSEQRTFTSQTFGVELHSDLEAMFVNAERYGKYLHRTTLVTKDGTGVPVEMGLSLLKDSENKTKGLLITAQDVSEQQHFEQLKQDFISRVSHEMRTPLHGIMGMVEILRFTELTEEQSSMLDIAQSKSDVLLTLINDILEYSKIQSGSLEIQRVAADVGILISNISEVLQHRLYAKETKLNLTLSPDIPLTVYCDPVRLYQIILSLSDNITQFATGGTICIDFDYLNKTSQKDGLYICLYASDARIDEDIQHKVFTPFVDENDSKEQFHPAGLQISLLRGIVQQMGGLLWLEQNPSTGATFNIFLSIDKEKIDKVTSDKATSDKVISDKEKTDKASISEIVYSPSQTSGIIKAHDLSVLDQAHLDEQLLERLVDATIAKKRTVHILIVDDDGDNRNLATTFLANIGDGKYSVILHTANDGVEAVAQFTAYTMDIILMDIQMPIMDGFDATRQIRDLERMSKSNRTPIVAITAHVMDNYREKCLQAGMDDYLSKPVKKKQLNDMVHKWLEHRKVVMLVDDSEDYSLIMQMQFEKSKRYNLLMASDGRQAIELFQEHDVHAIVMDMEMPMVNGYEATKVIRQMPKGRTIPIYAMTAHNGKKEIQRTLDVGCTQCFTKTGLDSIKQVITTLGEHFEMLAEKETV